MKVVPTLEEQLATRDAECASYNITHLILLQLCCSSSVCSSVRNSRAFSQCAVWRILISVLASDWGVLSRLIGPTSETRNINGSLLSHQHQLLQTLKYLRKEMLRSLHQQPDTRDHHLLASYTSAKDVMIYMSVCLSPNFIGRWYQNEAWG